MTSNLIRCFQMLLVGALLTFLAAASAIAAETHMYPADTAGLVGGASKVAGGSVSGGYLAS